MFARIFFNLWGRMLFHAAYGLIGILWASAVRDSLSIAAICATYALFIMVVGAFFAAKRARQIARQMGQAAPTTST